MKPVKVGICGLGTVGGGTYNVLKRNAEEIARRAGRKIIVEEIGARHTNPDCDTKGIQLTDDVFAVAKNPEIDVVVELIGGYDVAKELVLTAIEHGKHVVTANKALIAVHGNEIFEAAQKKMSWLHLKRRLPVVFRSSKRSVKACLRIRLIG